MPGLPKQPYRTGGFSINRAHVQSVQGHRSRTSLFARCLLGWAVARRLHSSNPAQQPISNQLGRVGGNNPFGIRTELNAEVWELLRHSPHTRIRAEFGSDYAPPEVGDCPVNSRIGCVTSRAAKHSACTADACEQPFRLGFRNLADVNVAEAHFRAMRLQLNGPCREHRLCAIEEV